MRDAVPPPDPHPLSALPGCQPLTGQRTADGLRAVVFVEDSAPFQSLPSP